MRHTPALAIAALLLAGCASGNTAEREVRARDEAAYLEIVRLDPQVTDLTDDELLTLGDGICGVLGDRPEGERQAEYDGALAQGVSAVAMVAIVTELCPEYAGLAN